MKGTELFIKDIPQYASLCVEKNSKGLGGEIYIRENKLEFFNLEDNIFDTSVINKKKIYKLRDEDRYYFDRDNLLEYLQDVKEEYDNRLLHKYREFKRDIDSSKVINLEQWEKRYLKIKSEDRKIYFDMYIKESTKGRCYIGSESEFYSFIIAYTIIPCYTSLSIKRKEVNDNKSEFIFLLNFNQPEDCASIVRNKYEKLVEKKEKKTVEELYNEIKKEDVEVIKKKTTAVVYSRNSSVSAYAKKRANGRCDLCGCEAPFIKINGEPYLEEHHVKPLAEGGDDLISNAVALCPNCHRKMHVVKDKNDLNILKKRLLEYSKVEKCWN